MLDNYDCPLDIDAGDEIDMMHGGMGPFRLKVVERWKENGTPFIRVTAADGSCPVIALDSSWTWRRAGARGSSSSHGYGAHCSDKTCREWCPDAEAVPNFKCFRCRSRYR